MQQDKCNSRGPDNTVSQKIERTPLKGGGASFCTYKLVEVSPMRIEFKAAFGAKLFYLFFLIAGTGLITLFLYHLLIVKYPLLSTHIIVPFGVGSIFTTVGACMLYFGTAPVVFDKNNGYFWKGRKSPDAVFDIHQIKACVKLEKIRAIQLLSEICSGNKSSYASYEINLVLEDNNRVNVVDHGNLKRIRNDADKLSIFLGKPIWNSIDN